MSRVIDAAQHEMLTKLRQKIHVAAALPDKHEMFRCIGIEQGYLIGLHVAGEIDLELVEALQTETLDSVYLQLNAQRAPRGRVQ